MPMQAQRAESCEPGRGGAPEFPVRTRADRGSAIVGDEVERRRMSPVASADFAPARTSSRRAPASDSCGLHRSSARTPRPRAAASESQMRRTASGRRWRIAAVRNGRERAIRTDLRRKCTAFATASGSTRSTGRRRRPPPHSHNAEMRGFPARARARVERAPRAATFRFRVHSRRSSAGVRARAAPARCRHRAVAPDPRVGTPLARSPVRKNARSPPSCSRYCGPKHA